MNHDIDDSRRGPEHNEATPGGTVLESPVVVKGSTASKAPLLLVNDLIIDDILVRLDVQDVIHLRQVSSQYRSCTYEPVLWKRIIKFEDIDLPPLPPTEKYSYPKLTAIEAERLVTRSVSLSAQWDKNELECLRRWDIEAPRIALEMALLPGGHYLVASVTDHTRTRFSIEVFTSDYNYSMGFPVARLETETMALDLQAKYMTFHGRPGIVIAYIRRDYRRERHITKFNINALPVDADSDGRVAHMLKYECVATFISLSSLEVLFDSAHPTDGQTYRTRAKAGLPPFQLLTEITSRSRLSNPIIYANMHGAPFIAVVKQGPDRIVHKNLDGGVGSTLQCKPHPLYATLPHTIMALRVLPGQHQFIVVRRAGADPNPPNRNEGGGEGHPTPGPYYFAEFFDIVDAPGTVAIRAAVSRSSVHDAEGNQWRKVWLSDNVHSPGPSLRPYLGGRPGPVAAQPLSIFVDAVLSPGITFESLFPIVIEDVNGAEPTRFVYELSEDRPFISIERLPAHIESIAQLYDRRVLPGSTRPVGFYFPRKRRRGHSFEIRSVLAMWDARLLRKHGADAGSEGDADGGGQSRELEGPPRGVFTFEPGDLSDVSTLAWDETIGRLCIGYARSTRIAVFDFAGAPLRRDV